MLVKLFMGFVYVNVILGYVESSYSGVTGYHDAIRRMALVKAAHIIRNGASQPQSYSTPLVIISQDFLLFFFRLVSLDQIKTPIYLFGISKILLQVVHIHYIQC